MENISPSPVKRQRIGRYPKAYALVVLSTILWGDAYLSLTLCHAIGSFKTLLIVITLKVLGLIWLGNQFAERGRGVLAPRSKKDFTDLTSAEQVRYYEFMNLVAGGIAVFLPGLLSAVFTFVVCMPSIRFQITRWQIAKARNAVEGET